MDSTTNVILLALAFSGAAAFVTQSWLLWRRHREGKRWERETRERIAAENDLCPKHLETMPCSCGAGL